MTSIQLYHKNGSYAAKPLQIKSAVASGAIWAQLVALKEVQLVAYPRRAMRGSTLMSNSPQAPYMPIGIDLLPC